MQEDEKERRVIVPDGGCLRRKVHPEQANESVGFVSGVEIIIAVGETTPPKGAHDPVWAFTTKRAGAGTILNERKRMIHKN